MSQNNALAKFHQAVLENLDWEEGKVFSLPELGATAGRLFRCPDCGDAGIEFMVELEPPPEPKLIGHAILPSGDRVPVHGVRRQSRKVIYRYRCPKWQKAMECDRWWDVENQIEGFLKQLEGLYGTDTALERELREDCTK